MKCKHCGDTAIGLCEIRGDVIIHSECVAPFDAAKHGRTHKCPMCKGTGWEYNRDVHTTESYDPSEGFGGYFTPLETRVVTRHEQKRCDFCEGHGYLKQKPEPIVEPARVVGWRKP